MKKSLPDWSDWILNKNEQINTERLNKGAAVKLPIESDEQKSDPKKGSSVFTMDHVNQVAANKDHGEAKKFAHSVVDSSSANPKNKAKIKMMINNSRNSAHLAQGMTNFILAHPGEGLRVVKSEDVVEKAAKDMVGDNVDSSMLMSELESLEHHIKEIREHLSSSEVAPDWVKAKVTKAASSMSDIAHYIMGVKEHKK